MGKLPRSTFAAQCRNWRVLDKAGTKARKSRKPLPFLAIPASRGPNQPPVSVGPGGDSAPCVPAGRCFGPAGGRPGGRRCGGARLVQAAGPALGAVRPGCPGCAAGRAGRGLIWLVEGVLDGQHLIERGLIVHGLNLHVHDESQLKGVLRRVEYSPLDIGAGE